MPKNESILCTGDARPQMHEPRFRCDYCDYNTSKKCNLAKHLKTNRHTSDAKVAKVAPRIGESIYGAKTYECPKCDKQYKSRNGLWMHSKTCCGGNYDSMNQMNNIAHLTTMVIEVVKNNAELQKQNAELQSKMFDICKNTTNQQQQINTTTTGNNNNHHNAHNKTFNINFFLNEQCKDAMNMSEFVKNINVSLADLENVGKVGYVEGISSIIIDNLKNTELCKRPIHCSDLKRETLYVKDENKWERSTIDNSRLKNAVRVVEQKNIGLMSSWADNHPDCVNSGTRANTAYMKLSDVVLDGEESNIQKVIKRVVKEVKLDKADVSDDEKMATSYDDNATTTATTATATSETTNPKHIPSSSYESLLRTHSKFF